jgi:hypothetical protein
VFVKLKRNAGISNGGVPVFSIHGRLNGTHKNHISMICVIFIMVK